MRYLLFFVIFLFPLKSSLSQDSDLEKNNNEFISYDLKTALKSVVNNHKLIVATQKDVDAAKLRVKQAEAVSFLLYVTANYGHENIIKYGAGNNTQLAARDATAKITQTITDFGFTRSNVKTSKLSLKQTRAMENQIRNDVLLRAITAYLRVIQSRESVKFAAQSVANIKKQADLRMLQSQQEGA